jgi:carbon monoxide dehydrogenase subunit G
MPSVNETITVSAGPEKAWEFLANPARYEEWLTMHDGWSGQPPTELRVGTAFQERVKLMGMVNKINWTVEAYDPPRSVTMSGTGLAGVRSTFVLSVTPTEEGAAITIDAEFTGSMVVGALGAAVTKDARKSIEASLATLAELVA